MCFCCSSASNHGGAPPPERSGALRTPDVSGVPGAPEGCDPQVSTTGATSNDGTPIAKTVPEADTTSTVGVADTSTVGEVAADGPTTMTGPTIGASSSTPSDDDNVVKEPEVVMGHPNLGALG
jgi:hypothetical protein